MSNGSTVVKLMYNASFVPEGHYYSKSMTVVKDPWTTAVPRELGLTSKTKENVGQAIFMSNLASPDSSLSVITRRILIDD